MTFGKLLRNILYPEDIKCIVCDCELAEANRYCVCDKCYKPVIAHYCRVCGKEVAEENTVCDRCKNESFAFTAARACFVYSDEVVDLVHRFKYHDERYLARYMVQYMSDVLTHVDWQIDAVTFVPMHWFDRVRRVYNQSRLLAEEVAKILGKPVIKALRKKTRNGHMAKLGKEERKRRIKDSFELIGDVGLRDKNVLLVDDVLTTGLTADECARTLRKGKCNDVYVITFATGKDRPMIV